jgi:hypothetical protein
LTRLLGGPPAGPADALLEVVGQVPGLHLQPQVAQQAVRRAEEVHGALVLAGHKLSAGRPARVQVGHHGHRAEGRDGGVAQVRRHLLQPRLQLQVGGITGSARVEVPVQLQEEVL